MRRYPNKKEIILGLIFILAGIFASLNSNGCLIYNQLCIPNPLSFPSETLADFTSHIIGFLVIPAILLIFFSLFISKKISLFFSIFVGIIFMWIAEVFWLGSMGNKEILPNIMGIALFFIFYNYYKKI